jgi:hypothetical protein
MLRITGDPFWADHTEEVAFNMYPAALMPDFKALHYITSPNMVVCDGENHYPGIANRGPFLMFNPFSSRCCQYNHAQGWPYFVENLWMATPDNGVAATIYSASSVKVKVGKGTMVQISEESNYPFEEALRFTVQTPESVEFPLYLRIPAWCKTARLKVNGEDVSSGFESGKYIRISRLWENNDQVELELPMQISVKRWEKNKNSVSVNYGPLTFSLKIKENYIKKDSDKSAIFDSKWQEGVDQSKWPSWEIRPGSNWNYGLILDNKLEDIFTIEKKPWPKSNYPFTIKDVPLVLKGKGKIIPEWKIDQHGLCGELMTSPVSVDTPTEDIELVPMGAARLRISAFPEVIISTK